MEKRFICRREMPCAETIYGTVRGYMYDGVYIFKGIEYGRAKRFHMPEEPQAWSGIRDALSYGYVSPLMHEEKPDGELYVPHMYWLHNENCLNLNIWTPSLEKSANKPVLVWFHGGGFESGSAVEQLAYDGAALCKYGDIVVISVNHRLNILGYIDLSDYGETYANSQNAGNEDLILALTWIQKNIRSFGGNPDNVTIFGQSGGGGKVASLMQMPKAAGLFHKAMIMSGILAQGTMAKEVNTRPVVKKMLKDLEIHGNNLEPFVELPYEALVRHYEKAYREVVGTGRPYFGPRPNEAYLGDEMNVGFSEFSKKIPVLIGSVIAEFTAFRKNDMKEKLDEYKEKDMILKKYGNEKGERLIHSLEKAYPGKRMSAIMALDSFAVRKSTMNWIQKRIKEGGAEIFSYMFSLEFPVDGGTLAWHCSDIPFFFHNTDKVPVANIEGVTDKLEEKMSGALAAFAYDGVPKACGLPKWPKCEDGREAVMVFDKECRLGYNFDYELHKELPEINPFSTIPVETIKH